MRFYFYFIQNIIKLFYFFHLIISGVLLSIPRDFPIFHLLIASLISSSIYVSSISPFSVCGCTVFVLEFQFFKVFSLYFHFCLGFLCNFIPELFLHNFCFASFTGFTLYSSLGILNIFFTSLFMVLRIISFFPFLLYQFVIQNILVFPLILQFLYLKIFTFFFQPLHFLFSYLYPF